MRKIKRYGWLPDLPDQRDFLFAAPPIKLPKKVDLRPHCPPVYDQGQLGSCTANAIGAAHQFEQMNQGATSAFVDGKHRPHSPPRGRACQWHLKSWENRVSLDRNPNPNCHRMVRVPERARVWIFHF